MGIIFIIVVIIVGWVIYDKFFSGFAQLQRGLDDARGKLYQSVKNDIDNAKQRYRKVPENYQDIVTSEFKKLDKHYRILTTTKDAEERSWALEDIEKIINGLARKFPNL